ncbi:MAG: alkaline shock response membrane anchor protein AmaP [Desulfotomaculaceae bacterium]
MKVVSRLILVLLGLLLAAVGLFLIALRLGLVQDYGTGLSKVADGPVVVAVGAALVLVAVFLFALGLRSSKPAVPDSILQTNENGAIRISIIAIENMVLRVVQQTSGIKDNGRQVYSSPDGLIIKVKIMVMPDLDLPKLINELQLKVKNYVEETTGLITHEINILVENIVLEQVPTKKRVLV